MSNCKEGAVGNVEYFYFKTCRFFRSSAWEQSVITSSNFNPQSRLRSVQGQLPVPLSRALASLRIASSNPLSDEKKHKILRMPGHSDLLMLCKSHEPMQRESESRPLSKSEKYEHGK